MLAMYKAIMDPSVNPLRFIPPAQRFQTMLFLSVMWTTMFCALAGTWLWYGELIFGHLLLVLGAFITMLTFRNSSR